MKIQRYLCVMILFTFFLLTGCSSEKEAVELETTIILGSESIKGLYSGKTASSKPEGEGLFQVIGENEDWSYEGDFTGGTAAGEGFFTNRPLTVTLAGKEYSGTYIGSGIDGVINGIGEFTYTDSDGLAINYQGTFENGQIVGIGEARNLPLTVIYQDHEYPGIYNGDFSDDAPNGMGIFYSENDEIYLSYDGNWTNSSFSGEGILSTNNYTMEFSDIIRVGIFDGDLIDGIPNGTAEFSVEIGDEVSSYIYSGEWQDGRWNGQGVCSYSDWDTVLEGTFVENEFTPTLQEFDYFNWLSYKARFLKH